MKEEEILKCYKEELSEIPPLTTEEEALLRADLHGTDEEKRGRARDRLIEAKLPMVVECVMDVLGRGPTAMELINEGNLLLLEAMEDLEEGDTDDVIRKRIEEGFQDFIHQEEDEKKLAKQIADDLNMMEKMTEHYIEKTGKEPDISILAKAMNRPEAEIEELLTILIQALSANEEGDTDEHQKNLCGEERGIKN